MEILLQDLRYALRQLRRAPGFTVTAIVTLALGIGVTVTVAALVRQVLLAPLPYPQPQQIVGVAFDWRGPEPTATAPGPAADFLMRNTRSFSSMALVDSHAGVANFSSASSHVESVTVLRVSRVYFGTLGVSPAIGRGFTAEEDRQGGPQALVLSYGFWKRAFAADPSIVGRTVDLNGEAVTVAGVMPKSFRAEAASAQGNRLVAPDVWRDLQPGPKDPAYGGSNYDLIARLRPGITIAQAQSELAALQSELYRTDPYYKTWRNEAGQTPVLQVWPYAAIVSGGIHTSLLVMAWAAGAVLLLTCLNLAGLNTARALHRAREFSLRMALGASRGRLLRLALLEVGALALAGSAGAVALSGLLLPFLLKASPVPIPQLAGAAGVAAIAAAAAGGSLVCALVFGAPLAGLALWLRGSKAGANQRGEGASWRQASLGRWIVILQMSLALVLLSVSTLLLGTFLKLRAQPLGFQPEKLLVFQTNLKGDRYASTDATMQFVDKVLARLQSAPGVHSAAAVSGLPFDRGLNINLEALGNAQEMVTVEYRAVTPGYLHAMGLALQKGRDLSADDENKGAHAAVISAAAARHWWPRRNALGQTLHLLRDPITVVGVVADAPQKSMAEAPPLTVYAPMAQQADSVAKMMNGWFPVSFVVRTDAQVDLASAIRSAVASADAGIPITHLTSMRSVIDQSMAAPRFFAEITEGFAAFAVLLMAIGIFGLLSYQVTQRTHEIGVRMALGASRGRILQGVMRTSVSMAFAGSVIGLVGAVLFHPLLSHWIARSVVGLESGQQKLLFNGAATILIALAAVALTAIAAAIVPARRASRVEPMQALRTE